MAHVSDDAGRREVYVRPFPATGAKVQVSTAGGSQPSWRRDGEELFFVAPERKLMAVDVKTGSATFQAGVPRALYEARHLPPGYSVTAQADRFLLDTLEERASFAMHVVIDWDKGPGRP